MTKCIHCGSDMIWGSDESSETFDFDGRFIDSFYSCTNENCDTTATFTHKIIENEKYVTTATGLRYTKEYCLEIIRSVIDPDSELYDDIKYHIGE